MSWLRPWSTVVAALLACACADDSAPAAGASPRLCGADRECTLPELCRGHADGVFSCEAPPATGVSFGEPVNAVVDGKQVRQTCQSGVDDGTFCTRVCRADQDCGGALPSCKNLPSTASDNRLVPVCQKAP